MAKFFFRYGTVNSGKSMELLKVAYNYRQQGKKVFLFSPQIDDRFGVGKITTRSGLQENAIVIDHNVNIFNIVSKNLPVDCVLVDEIQFLDKENICKLHAVARDLNVPVIGYGLKQDYMNKLFEGSEWALVYADSVQEIKTICWFCNNKATMNLRIKDGKPVYEGNSIQIEKAGKPIFIPVCKKCYIEPSACRKHSDCLCTPLK